MAKLKVYCTPIGFHDAYVAAPSQKAALAAWGSDANLFARGVAEQVTDPALMKAPLAKPGEIVRTLRGTPDERRIDKPKRKATPKPKPSRVKLDAAEAALEDLEKRQAVERAKAAARVERERKTYDAALTSWRG